MGARDPRIDAYIARSADFARPILTYLRATVHAACPKVEETLKWSHPTFMYEGMLCSMAAFKQHCTFGFWKGKLIVDTRGRSVNAMGQFGRITGVSELPSKKEIAGYVKRAMKLNEEGVKPPRPLKHPKPKLAVPADLVAAFKRNRRAASVFDAFSPSQRREYIEWITGAKRDETRKRRLENALAWIAQGKPHNWKYMNSR